MWFYKMDCIIGEVLFKLVDGYEYCWDGICYSFDGYIKCKGQMVGMMILKRLR